MRLSAEGVVQTPGAAKVIVSVTLPLLISFVPGT